MQRTMTPMLMMMILFLPFLAIVSFLWPVWAIVCTRGASSMELKRQMRPVITTVETQRERERASLAPPPANITRAVLVN